MLLALLRGRDCVLQQVLGTVHLPCTGRCTALHLLRKLTSFASILPDVKVTTSVADLLFLLHTPRLRTVMSVRLEPHVFQEPSLRRLMSLLVLILLISPIAAICNPSAELWHPLLTSTPSSKRHPSVPSATGLQLRNAGAVKRSPGHARANRQSVPQAEQRQILAGHAGSHVGHSASGRSGSARHAARGKQE